MNFCQKHQNHHCVHAHQCKNPDHKAKQTKNSMKKTNKSHREMRATTLGATNIKNLSKIVEQPNEECDFDSNPNLAYSNQPCSSCVGMEKKIRKLENDNDDLRNQMHKLNKKLYNLSEQNRQMEGVLEYYRAQMDRIVKCSGDDYKQEIKKHLKDSQQLNSRNKFLLSKLANAENEIQRLEATVFEMNKKLANESKEKQKICTNYDTLFDKFRKISTEDQKKGCDLTNEKKKNTSLESRYQIIMEETQKKLDQNARQIRKLTTQNKQYMSSIQILNKKLSNFENLHKMDCKNSEDREKIMKRKIEQLESSSNILKERNYELEKQNKLKKEEVDHCKRVIDKQIRAAKANGQLVQEMDKKTVTFGQNKQNEDRNEDRPQSSYQEDKKDCNQGYIHELEQQIKTLKQKLKNNSGQNPSSSVIQQYILTIGASEAFKKIIEQKNVYIKKLIREKGQLLGRM